MLPPVCILVGGRATRLGEIAKDRPKALVEVAGRPLIDHQLEALRASGARRVVMCVGHLSDRLQDAVGTGRRHGLRIDWSHDGPRLAGTAGAIRRALPLLGDEFLVLYGDTLLRVDHAAVARARRERGAPGLMTVLRNRDRWGISNAVYEDGWVTAYDKRAPPAGADWIDYGLGAYAAEAFAGTGEADLADVQHRMAREGRMAGFPVRLRFYEIGTPEGLREATAFLRRRARAAGERTTEDGVPRTRVASSDARPYDGRPI